MNKNEKDITILAIETSCDETAAAVVKNGREVLSNVIHTQIAIHETYGGVVPEIASRENIKRINQLIKKALADSGVDKKELDCVGVTYGPGLVGALLTGVSVAKAFAFAAGLPLVGVNHIEGHICANFIATPDLEPPFLCLVVSGGHTHLTVVHDYCEYELIGRTRDDAAGEAFDKVARAIGLGYPGGPKIDAAAKTGNPHAFDFPKAKVNGSAYDFSFSGLKSAVLNTIHNASQRNGSASSETLSNLALDADSQTDASLYGLNRNDIAASFEQAVVDVLAEHSMLALKEYGYKKLALAGGVAANSALRERLSAECQRRKIGFYCPPPALCTDNAAMIGSAAYYRFCRGELAGWDLNAIPGLKLL